MSDDAPGWDAIDAALGPVVGDRKPDHWDSGTQMRQTTTADVLDRLRSSNPLLVTGGPGLNW